MDCRSIVPAISKTRLCVLCWAWVIALGTTLVAWNVHAGYPARAKVVGLLMVFGASVYVANLLSTVYRQDGQAL